jgi:hypothetical protein
VRGKTLESILNSVRAEARLSLLPANNNQVRDSHVILIQREQERLWEDYAWPHLRVHHLEPLQAGQRLYETPTEDDYTIQMDRIEKIEVFDGGSWRKLSPEFDDGLYSVHNSDLDERSWPARAWRATADDDIEIWPIPDQNGVEATLEGYLRITGIRDLQAFTTDNHRADLDDRLISLYVAGGILAASGAKDAQLKLEAANKLYTKLKGKQTKSTSFNMFSTTRPESRRRKLFAPPFVPSS